jgi:hypothetical protein
MLAHSHELLLLDFRFGDHVFIADDHWCSRVGDGAHCQFRVTGNAQFTDQNQIVRRPEHLCDRCGHRDAATREGEDNNVVPFVFGEPLGELAAGFWSIAKRHEVISNSMRGASKGRRYFIAEVP